MDSQNLLQGIDIVVIVVYLVGLLTVGFWASRGLTKDSDLFLGGRSLNWVQIGFSLFSTNVSPMMLIGFAGLSYTTGIVGSNFEWLAWTYLLLLTMLFAPHYRRNNISTMPGFLKVRFGERSYNFLAIYTLISIIVIWLGSGLYAGGVIISQVLGWPLWLSVVCIAAIALSYTITGGLKAIASTDVFQSILIILASMVLGYLALQEIGGLTALANAVPDDYWYLFRPTDDPDYPWHAVMLGYPVVGIYYWCTDQTIVQKVLAGKSTRQGQYGAIFTSFLKVLMPFVFLVPGIMCFVLYPGLENSDYAYMTLVTNLMPPGLVGLIVAGLMAALINTIAAGFNSFSTVFTLDIYTKKINPHNNTPSETHRIGQVMTLVAALLSIGLAITFQYAGKNLFDITQGLASLLAPPLSVVFVVGVLWKKATNKAAEITLYGGGTICVLLGMCHLLNFPYEGYWPHFMLLSFYLFAGLMVIMVIVSWFTQATDGRPLSSLKEAYAHQKEKPSAAVWALWGVIFVIMIGIYIFFN